MVKRLSFYLLLIGVAFSSATSQTLSSNFTIETLVTNLEVPWAMRFADDGRLFFTERPGRLSVLQAGKVTRLAGPDKFPGLRVEGEIGLMGLALEPDFASSAKLYVCYGYMDASESRKLRIMRFTLMNDSLEQPVTILDDIQSNSGHGGCRLAFGPDGKLYISVGEAFNPALAQDITSYAGKILRLNSDGTIPSDNPFGNAVWTLGHRNPQGLVFQSETGRLYSTEHGPDKNDELNLIEKGANYGWPDRQGTEAGHGFTGALKSYYPDETIAIAGIDSYRGNAFPFANDLLFVSLKAGRLYRVILQEDGRVVNDEILLDRTLNSDLGRLRDVAVSPEGLIYLATSNQNDRNPAPHPADDRIVVLKPK